MKSQHVKCVELFCQSKWLFSLSLPKSHGQLKLWKELYTCTPQDICNYASVFYGVKGIKKSSSDFKDLAYWDIETITSMIHYLIHEFHQTDVKVMIYLIWMRSQKREITNTVEGKRGGFCGACGGGTGVMVTECSNC